MEYFILIVLFSTSFSKSVSKTRMNLLSDLKAPLFAELDVSNVQNYIDTKIDTRLDHINDTLDDKIEALIDNKMTVDCSNNLNKTKLENDERVAGIISDLTSLKEIVKNLKNENNQLKEHYKEWKKNECGRAKTDLVIILDGSTSVGPDNFKKMLRYVKDFLANADIDSGNVQAGILTYSTSVKIQFQIGQYKTSTELQKAIDEIPYPYGSTNTADAIRTMATKMFTTSADRSDAPNIAVLVTDGVSNINKMRTIPNAVEARAKNIHIYSIGIGLSYKKEIFDIATPPPEENSFIFQSFDELRDLGQKIFFSKCSGS